ncbi:MAG: hypothetical protein A2V77_13630 [Anaeromyxobacter sp. RBG_16_69_14]|nr:MAG: hypothetical protein A2V77_13630 [Anaeromyxobacter sp. RBG_16_69_14]
MRFLIAETFMRSLDRLDVRARAVVKQAVFDFQANPTRPGTHLHRLARPRGQGLWSLRVDRDVRIIVHRDGEDVVLCHTDHHDRAYAWAERRTISLRAADIDCAAEVIEVVERTQAVGPAAGSISAGGVDAPSRCTPREGPAALPRRGPSRSTLRLRRRATAPLSGGVCGSRSEEPAPLLELFRLARRQGAIAEELPSAAGCPAPRATVAPPARVKAALAAVVLALSGLAAATAHVAAARCGVALAFAAGVTAAAAAGAVVCLTWRAVAWPLSVALDEVARLGEAMRAGRLDARVDPARIPTTLWPIADELNGVVEAFVRPFRESATVLEGLACADAVESSTAARTGELERHRAAVGALAHFLLLGGGDLRHLVASAGGQTDPAGAGRSPARDHAA